MLKTYLSVPLKYDLASGPSHLGSQQGAHQAREERRGRQRLANHSVQGLLDRFCGNVRVVLGMSLHEAVEYHAHTRLKIPNNFFTVSHAFRRSER